MRRRLGATVLGGVACTLVFLLGAAAARPTATGRYGGVLVVGVTRGDPDTLDPTLTNAFTSIEVFRAICLRLYDFDARSRVVPELAAALPTMSKDKLTYTIPLRHGIEFNDGTPFNAQAVATSLERDLTLPGSARASDLSSIAGVDASGPYTAVIHLKAPFTPLLDTLATNDGIVMSPAQLAKLGASFGTDPVCVGPFMFDHRVVGESTTVIKSPYYYDRAAVHLDKIVFQDASSGPAGTAALRAGDIQMLDNVSPSEVPALTQDPNVRLLKQSSLGWQGIEINIGNRKGIGNVPYSNVGKPLAASPALRQAFDEAIDRTTLARVVYGGAAVPDCTPISPSSTWYDPSVHCLPYDPQQARKLVARSGFSNPTVHLLTPGGTSEAVAEFVQAEEAVVGIDVVIDQADVPTILAAETNGSFDAVVTGWTGSPAVDRNVYQFVATSGSRNAGGYSNPSLDLDLDNARKATSVTALKTLYHAALKILVTDEPIVYLAHPIVYAPVSTDLAGVEFLSDIQARVDFAQYK